jgi:hypothetical protein
MPRGIYPHKLGIVRRKPDCLCGICKLCVHRISNRKYRSKLKKLNESSVRISDSELDERMNKKFIEMGWD